MFGTTDAHVGQAAGVATSLLWTATALFFAASARRIGPTAVNATRIPLAFLILGVTHRILTGQWIPDVAAGQVAYLAASGIIGLSIGDQALLTAFVDIGPRQSMLIMTTSPIFAVFFGWSVLGETLPGIAWIGVALTVGGVAWVVMERPDSEQSRGSPRRLRGVMLALVGAACQAAGLLLSKQGMGHGWLPADERLAPQAATLIRMMFAGIGMVPIVALHAARERRRRSTGVCAVRTGSVKAGLVLACFGAVTGPYLGVWCSLVASDRTALGIAQTLCSLTPIFLLPVVVVVHKERLSRRAVIGAVIAVTGAVLLFVLP